MEDKRDPLVSVDDLVEAADTANSEKPADRVQLSPEAREILKYARPINYGARAFKTRFYLERSFS